MHLRWSVIPFCFPQFDGKEEFTIRISRSRQDDLKQLKVFAEMTEEHTEDTANATQPFSIYDAEYRALVIKPIPNTVQGDAEYKFFVSSWIMTFSGILGLFEARHQQQTTWSDIWRYQIWMLRNCISAPD